LSFSFPSPQDIATKEKFFGAKQEQCPGEWAGALKLRLKESNGFSRF
jgi:hypothetical protein